MGPNSLRLIAAGAGAVVLAVLLVWTGERLVPEDGSAEASDAGSADETTGTTDVATRADPAAADTEETKAPPPTAINVDYFELGPDGRATVAGRTRPGAGVVLLLDGTPVARLETEADGSFVAFPRIAASDRLRPLTFEVDGVTAGSDTIFVQPGRGAVPAETPSGNTLAMADSAISEAAPPGDDEPTPTDGARDTAEASPVPVPDEPGERAGDDAGGVSGPSGEERSPGDGAAIASDGAAGSDQSGTTADVRTADMALSDVTTPATRSGNKPVVAEATVADLAAPVADRQGQALATASGAAAPGDGAETATAALTGAEGSAAASPVSADPAARDVGPLEVPSQPATDSPAGAPAADGGPDDPAVASAVGRASVDAEPLPTDPAGQSADGTLSGSGTAVARDGLGADPVGASDGPETEGRGMASRPAALDSVGETAPSMAQDAPARPARTGEVAATSDLSQRGTDPRPGAGAGRDLDPPPALIVTADGVRSAAPQVMDRVALDAISYDDSGEVRLAGRGPEAGALQVYIDNRPVSRSPLGSDGGWQLTLPDVDPGTYTLRIDQLDETGAVASRIETPFLKEDPATVRALRRDGGTVRQISTRTVQPGATLWAIATDRFADGMMYVAIYQANRDQIRDPDLIYPGQVFVLPETAPVGIAD